MLALKTLPLVRRVAALFNHWRQRARGRAELTALDDRMLDDIGLTRIDIARGSRSPFRAE